jgi:hypothetical protein
MSEDLRSEVTRRIFVAQASFAHSASDAASALDGLAPAIPLAAVLAAALSLLGLQQRINEYR